MYCVECKTDSNYYDETLGERVCSFCGLVLIENMFEETVHILNSQGEVIHSPDNNELGSVVRGKDARKYNRFNTNTSDGLMYCNMILSSVSSSEEVKERTNRVYSELLAMPSFVKYSYENRACAVVFYVLREMGIPKPMKKIVKEFDVDTRLANKLLRKINKFYKNKINIVSPIFYIEQSVNQICNDLSFLNQCKEVLEKFEMIIADSYFNKSRSYYACICWITSNIYNREYTRTEIAQKTNFDEKCIYIQTKQLLGLIGVVHVQELKGIEVNKIGV